MTAATASVVVPVFNGEHQIADAISSLLAQDHPSVEVIVVNDGSTDGTADVVARFPEVRYLEQENGGPAAARNAGIGVASGEFVGFLDADDIAPPTKLAAQIGRLLEYPEVTGVLGRQQIVLEDGVDVPEWLGHDPYFGDLGGVNPISLVTRRQVLEEIGGFDTSEGVWGGEDRDLLIRLREAGANIVVLDDVVLIRRIHGDNITYETRAERYPLLHALHSKLDRERSRERRS